MLGTNKDVVVVEDIVVDNLFSIHHASWITSGPRFVTIIYRQKPFGFSSAARNNTWLITSS